MFNDLFVKIIGGIINFFGLFSDELAGRWALQIFRTPREGRLDEGSIKFLSTAELRKKVGRKGNQVMTYLWNASGKKEVLLLHGWESNASRWQPLIELLIKKDFRVTAIDAPAHGDSDGKRFDMVQYVNAIDAKIKDSSPDFVVGHSLGGSSFAFYLNRIRHPQFEKIVLMGIPSELYELTINFGELMGLTQRTFKALVEAFKSTFDLEIKSISVRQFCKSIQIKTLVIHDHQDDIARVEDAIVYHDVLADSELFLTHKHGHSLQAPEVYGKIMSFIGA